jgi:hypothetical protein
MSFGIPVRNGLGVGLLASTTLSTRNRAPFSPASLFATGEQGAWYDPSDLTTLFQDSAGTTPVTAAGQQVGRINDKSGRGNNATQSTSGQRPTLGREPYTGVRNLLTFTEQFDNAAWGVGGLTVTANTTVAPNGVTAADTITGSSGSNAVIFPAAGFSASATSYTASCYVKAGSAAWIVLSMWQGSGTLGVNVWFNAQTGAVGSNNATAGYVFTSASSTAVGNGWYRITVTGTVPVSTVFWSMRIVDGDNAFVYTNTVGDTVNIWGAQLETGSTATAYQRVVSSFDVTQAGVPDVWYLSFDGSDDGMLTGTITPGVDKMQMFAGVRKLSDAATGSLVELSTSFNNTGSFGVVAPASNNTSTYQFVSTGTGQAAPLASGFAAPITNVLAGTADIAGDSAILRVNGAQVASSTANQGTGNYLAYPLYVGRRAGTSLPLNGRIYSLILRFGANLSASTILQTETWVGDKTGINIPLSVSPTIYDRFNDTVLDRAGQTIEVR